MAAALEEQMKSERLKSELITNVSHDIKTPLTSIINYVDLIKAEPVDNPKVQEYIAVLDRQSARLKKLTCDLVDASKASSGAMPVHLEDVDVCELLQQAVGEYSERLGAGQLTPVFDLPEEPVLIRADGALLWRVIDNLLSNICKYALPGTRLYISMERSGEQMTVQMKNVSRAPLNIPADELMERFVRRRQFPQQRRQRFGTVHCPKPDGADGRRFPAGRSTEISSKRNWTSLSYCGRMAEPCGGRVPRDPMDDSGR